MSTQTSLLKHAHGLKFFPCIQNDKIPACMWKNVATSDPIKLEALFKGRNSANVGMVVTKDLMVLDVDTKSGKFGAASLADLEDIHGKLPACPTQRTASGGLHLVFKLPEGVEVKNSAGKVGKDLDIRSGGTGYIVVEPSTIDGGKYEWIIDSPLVEGEWQPPLAPNWLIKLAISQSVSLGEAKTIAPIAPHESTNYDLVRIKAALAVLKPEHANNYDTWLSIGMMLHKNSLGNLEIWKAWSKQSATYEDGVCDSKWLTFDANIKGGVAVASLFYLAWGQPLSDLGNANRLAQTYGAGLRFVKGLGWFRWSNG